MADGKSLNYIAGPAGGALLGGVIGGIPGALVGSVIGLGISYLTCEKA